MTAVPARRAAALALLWLALALEANAARVLLAAKAADSATSAKAADAASAAAGAKGADQYWPGAGGPGFYGGGGGGGSPGFDYSDYGGGGGGAPGYYSGYGNGRAARRADRRAARQAARAWRRYDRSYLSAIMPTTPAQYASPMRAAPLGPDAMRFSNSFANADARAAATGMLGGRSDVVAMGIVDAAARGRRANIANAMASAAAMNQAATASVLAQSASTALARGQASSFADATADAFIASRRRGSIRNFGLAMADACAQGGDEGQLAYGQAIAKALAQGGDGQAAVAEATAEVYCSGVDDYASAWSSAFAVALSQDQNGCLVLSKARALATASCGGGAFNSYSDSDATSKVLGFCGLFPPGAAPTFGFSSTDNGSNSFSG